MYLNACVGTRLISTLSTCERRPGAVGVSSQLAFAGCCLDVDERERAKVGVDGARQHSGRFGAVDVALENAERHVAAADVRPTNVAADLRAFAAAALDLEHTVPPLLIRFVVRHLAAAVHVFVDERQRAVGCRRHFGQRAARYVANDRARVLIPAIALRHTRRTIASKRKRAVGVCQAAVSEERRPIHADSIRWLRRNNNTPKTGLALSFRNTHA